MRYIAIVGCLFASIILPPEVQGQRNDDPGSRGWGKVALGWGWMHCEECDTSASGPSLGLSWGLAVNESFLVALSVDAIVGGRYRRERTGCIFPAGCGEVTSEGRDIVFTIAPIVRLYPFPASGLFLRGGIGLGLTGMGDPNTLFHFGPEAGLGTTLGIGWDFRLGQGNIAVTPLVNGAWIRASDQTSNSVHIGLGLTFH